VVICNEANTARSVVTPVTGTVCETGSRENKCKLIGRAARKRLKKPRGIAVKRRCYKPNSRPAGRACPSPRTKKLTVKSTLKGSLNEGRHSDVGKAGTHQFAADEQNIERGRAKIPNERCKRTQGVPDWFCLTMVLHGNPARRDFHVANCKRH